MIVDSSAIMAVVLAEPDAGIFLSTMESAGSLRMASPTLVEVRLAAERRRGPEAVDLIEDLLADLEIEIIPFTAEHADLANAAWRRFGKPHHSAALNLGDTYSYALAKATGEPLLFKGDDFTQTDVASAL